MAQHGTTPGLSWPSLVEELSLAADIHELSLRLSPEIAWLLVLGSGFRGMLTGLEDSQTAAVRHGYLAALERDGIAEVDATTLVGTGLC